MLLDDGVEGRLEFVNIYGLFVFQESGHGGVALVKVARFAPVADAINSDQLRELRSHIFDPEANIFQQFLVVLVLEVLADSISEVSIVRTDVEQAHQQMQFCFVAYQGFPDGN